MNQYVYVSLSLIGLCGIVGAGVAIGSGYVAGKKKIDDSEILSVLNSIQFIEKEWHCSKHCMVVWLS